MEQACPEQRACLLRTARLTLRPFCAADAPAVARALADFETTRWLARAPHPYHLADAQAFAHRVQDKSVWAIENGAGFAGMIGMEGELGYWLAPEARGRNYAYEAAHLLVARHFSDPAVSALKAGYFIGNQASARVLQKLGFRPDGPMDHRFSLAWHSARPHQDLLLTRADWARLTPPEMDLGDVQITPLKPSDSAVFHRLATMPEIGRMLARYPADWSLAQAGAFLEGALWSAQRPCRLALRKNGQLIGSLGIGAGTPAELFYFLDPAHAGQGIMSRAVTRFIGWLEQFWGLRSLSAHVFADNPASRRVLERAGFRLVGQGQGRSAQRDGPAPDWSFCYCAP